MWLSTDWSLKTFIELPDGVQFIAWGEETAPTTGKQHHQGFAYGEKNKLATWAKLLDICGQGKVFGCQGNLSQNEAYCSKEGVYHKLGVPPMGDGKKRTLQQFTDVIIRNPIHPIDIVEQQPVGPLGGERGLGSTSNHCITVPIIKKGGTPLCSL